MVTLENFDIIGSLVASILGMISFLAFGVQIDGMQVKTDIAKIPLDVHVQMDGQIMILISTQKNFCPIHTRISYQQLLRFLVHCILRQKHMNYHLKTLSVEILHW